jgi:hypothetical protein
MFARRMLLILSTGLALALAQAAPHSRPALAQNSEALTGLVTTEAEGPMEGVLVSAKKAGSIITVTVVTDKQGRYSFPEARLEPGQYSLRIRAVGYDLEGPRSAEVIAEKTATADL